VLSIFISVGGRRVVTSSGAAEPDRERAETYLRVQAEAELQRPLGFLRGPVSDILEWRERRDEIRPNWREPAGERWLSSGWKLPSERRPANNRLLRIAAVARALAAAGAIDDSTAADVLADLEAALAIRSLIPTDQLRGSPMRSFASLYFPGQRLVRAPATPPVPVRLIPAGTVATCKVQRQRLRVYLGSMVVDGQSAALSITARLVPGRVPPKPLPVPWQILNNCTAADDQGSSYGIQFSGGGADDHWHGLLHLTPVPPAQTRWLDFSLPGTDPVRLRLDGAPRNLPTSEVSLPADGAADRYLDAQTAELLAPNDEDGDDEDRGKDTRVAWAARGLLGAGVVGPLNPALRRLAAVATRLGLQLPAPLDVVPAGPLAADWLSLLARWECHDGPTGAVPVAAHLPELDGAHCAIADLQSSADSATIEVHARGWPEPGDSRRPWGELFRWTARDDAGGWYVTTVKGWSFTDATADLTLELRPAINPAARELRVILTSRTGEVSVSVPLDWREGP
jgi:hypothetical protein